jgi:transcriptional regulator with XRE-family HTH domain
MKPRTFDDLYREAEGHDDYPLALLVHGFTEALVRRMELQGLSRAQLARRLGTSQAYVTKVLRGNVNFTLATLVKLGQATGAHVRLDLCEPARRSSKEKPMKKAITLRDLPAPLVRRIEEEASATGAGPEEVVVRLLLRATGLKEPTASERFHDLDALAGTWSAEDLAEFETAVADFERIDEELWR